MATIPIEIILQDAETPVDPTPTPEETNIVVPDTGAGTVGSSSTFSSSSVASIILPATLLVVALVAICTLLIHKHRKRQEDVLSRKEKLATAASGTIAILAATVLVGNLVIPATNAATSVEPGTAELETEDKITIIATREQDSDTITTTVKDTSYATANLDFGYKITASMAEGLTNANLYLDGDETSEYYISPVTYGTLADNTWGYTLEEPSEDSIYLSVPSEDTPATIVKGSGEIEDVPVDIYYTIKVDNSLPTGTYTGELEYSIAPAVEYMQDFAKMTEAEKTATLANMPEGKQYILKDIRDEKSYYISKLADGNAWMTQNLDHDIVSTLNFYTSSNTDLPNGNVWTGTATRITGDTDWHWLHSAPESYDPGNIYWGSELDIMQNDTTANSGDTHYRIGNYYNWTAAVAMSDSSAYTTDQQDVNQSICPAGWRLPTYSGNKSYQNLADKQSLTAGIYGNIHANPVYFVYGGYWVGSSEGVGANGCYWSDVVQYAQGTYLLNFDIDGNLDAQNPKGRSFGFSLRCVTR